MKESDMEDFQSDAEILNNYEWYIWKTLVKILFLNILSKFIKSHVSFKLKNIF